jgi:hypothetical protein
MPRAKLSNVSTAALHAEIQKRLKMLSQWKALRVELDRRIAELELIMAPAQAAQVAQAAPAPARRGRAKAAPKPVRKRGTFAQTAEQFVLGLVKGKGATSAEINKAWTKAGRGNRADTTLNILSNKKKVKREKLEGQKGSLYTLA